MVDMWLPPTIVDMMAKSPKMYRHHDRPSAVIDSICLHQMSVHRGNDPGRYSEVHAHFGVMPNGTIAQYHPVSSYLVASSAFNNDAIAIEFAGNFVDDQGGFDNPKVNGKTTLSADQISGGRDLVSYLRFNYGLSFIYAHRQGEHHNLRGNCPGPEIWYHIGEWAIANLGMSDGGKGYVEGRGSPIPDSWRKARA